jgi:hypothetical protein
MSAPGQRKKRSVSTRNTPETSRFGRLQSRQAFGPGLAAEDFARDVKLALAARPRFE